MLTKKDITVIRGLIKDELLLAEDHLGRKLEDRLGRRLEDRLGRRLEDRLGRKFEDLLGRKIKEELGYLPTREEFYTKMDEVMAELESIRQEKTILGHQVSELDDRVEALEEIHPGGVHPSS